MERLQGQGLLTVAALGSMKYLITN